MSCATARAIPPIANAKKKAYKECLREDGGAGRVSPNLPTDCSITSRKHRNITRYLISFLQSAGARSVPFHSVFDQKNEETYTRMEWKVHICLDPFCTAGALRCGWRRAALIQISRMGKKGVGRTTMTTAAAAVSGWESQPRPTSGRPKKRMLIPVGTRRRRRRRWLWLAAGCYDSSTWLVTPA